MSNSDKAWWQRFGAQVWQDWTGVLFPSRHNWSDFTLVHASAESEWCLGNCEVHLALVGVHLRLTWYWPHADRDALLEEASAWIEKQGLNDGEVSHD